MKGFACSVPIFLAISSLVAGAPLQRRDDQCNFDYPGNALIESLVNAPESNNKVGHATRLARLPKAPLQNEFQSFLNQLVPGNFKDVLAMDSKREYSTFGRCSLAKDPFVYSSNFPTVDKYMGNLFYSVKEGLKSTLSVNVELNRWDLWHGHLFLNKKTVGILFHAKEYPMVDEDFPYNLGWCQANSTVHWSANTMPLRNIIWVTDVAKLKPSLWVIDSSSNQDGSDPVLGEAPMYTINEEKLGYVMSDIYYLPQVQPSWSEYPRLQC
ncbi:hypothetical protein K493DRAFT_321022 [Basidiobolus meristosporus CBS 931.73]|uniref:Uncharacterized protein n=1 Tax=Basidiobolus meristosporus CBS 931.73 TaxID=1314790 RepID=A0A1Y1X1G7_9FUNG|nr:hypothetical protein K493DRAFT_321022 [Basidiobolus meristosporus CBS 931.73]|eukprot:ORX79613.1 hypothetical protein K493DRAFT_321022 [Basidiobolus meristosporus CBS 931.73]